MILFICIEFTVFNLYDQAIRSTSFPKSRASCQLRPRWLVSDDPKVPVETTNTNKTSKLNKFVIKNLIKKNKFDI